MCFQRALSEKITMRTFSPKMSEASDKVHIFAVNFVLPHIENFFTLHCLAVTVCALSPWLKLEFLCNWMITSLCARLGTVLHIRNLKKHNLISIQTLTHCHFLLHFLFLIPVGSNQSYQPKVVVMTDQYAIVFILSKIRFRHKGPLKI